MKLSILLFLSLLNIGHKENTDIDIYKHTISYVVGNRQLFVTEYRIQNNTSETCYTWFDNNKSIDNKEFERYYFWKRHGDFCFGNFLTDEVFFSSQFRPTIGISFLKDIKPGNKFSYFIVSEEEMDNEQSIYCISGSEFSKIVGTIVNQNILYQSDSVVIPFIFECKK